MDSMNSEAGPRGGIQGATMYRASAGIKSAVRANALLILLVVLLVACANFWAARESVEVSSFTTLLCSALLFPLLFCGGLALVFLIDSSQRARLFVDRETKQVRLHALWQSTAFNPTPVSSVLGSFAMGLGITGSSRLAEVYRLRATNWYDAPLWALEEPMLRRLLDSPLNTPLFWDRVYFLIWPVLFLGMALICKAGSRRRFLQIALATVFAFYITRVLNLMFPTAGPAFFRPEWFSLGNTLCVKVHEGLRLYMLGQLSQNGLMPGTMAMPSLHVGLAFLATWAMAQHWRRTLWITIPWLLLVWTSTVMLGWHYALDGVGGIAVAALSLALAQLFLFSWDLIVPSGAAIHHREANW